MFQFFFLWNEKKKEPFNNNSLEHILELYSSSVKPSTVFLPQVIIPLESYTCPRLRHIIYHICFPQEYLMVKLI